MPITSPSPRPRFETIYRLALALWLGGLVAIGAVVIPAVFIVLPRPESITLAVLLFRLQGLYGFALIGLLLICQLLGQLKTTRLEHTLLLITVLSSLALHFWIIPEMLSQLNSAHKSGLWHTASSASFAAQTFFAAALLVQRFKQR